MLRAWTLHPLCGGFGIYSADPLDWKRFCSAQLDCMMNTRPDPRPWVSYLISVGLLVCWSVGLSVCPSVRLSVCSSVRLFVSVVSADHY